KRPDEPLFAQFPDERQRIEQQDKHTPVQNRAGVAVPIRRAKKLYNECHRVEKVADRFHAELLLRRKAFKWIPGPFRHQKEIQPPAEKWCQNRKEPLPTSPINILRRHIRSGRLWNVDL